MRASMSEIGGAAVFLDRDGTLIRDVGYLCRPEQLEILPKVPEALQLVRSKGYKIVVVTNQSAIARGQLTEGMLAKIHQHLFDTLGRAGAHVDGVYYCPHHPTVGLPPYRTTCDCRKPNAGMIARAAADLCLAPSRSYLVGDQIIDMELAARSGARGIWIRPAGEAPLDVPKGVVRVVTDLWEAACWLSPAADHGSQNTGAL